VKGEEQTNPQSKHLKLDRRSKSMKQFDVQCGSAERKRNHRGKKKGEKQRVILPKLKGGRENATAFARKEHGIW